MKKIKQFVTYKKIYTTRFNIVKYFIFLSICFIFIGNIIFSFLLKNIDNNTILNSIVYNAYGLLFNNHLKNYQKINILYHNIFGFNYIEEKTVFKENNNVNMKEFITDKPIIYIYNTYQTSKYQKPSYNSYNINPVITTTSLMLAENLKSYNIPVLVEKNSVVKTLKDNNLEYSYSYKGSRILMENAKQNNDTLKYFLDIGMSDDEYQETTYQSDEASYAKILFIIGTDNPNYLENEKFANKLNDLLKFKNDNLSRGISLRGGVGYNGIYNEDFSPYTILIYVGGKSNTIDEVNRTIKVLAEVINDYLKGEA